MIFLTVGTLFTFDRLVKAVDTAVAQGQLNSEIIAQIGKGGYKPKNFYSVETLEKKYDAYFARADCIIAHAGMGTITMALSADKPILVVPRQKKYKELISDHQLATARRFEQLGHVLAVYNMNDLPVKLRALQNFQPTRRITQADRVAERIGRFLKNCRTTL